MSKYRGAHASSLGSDQLFNSFNCVQLDIMIKHIWKTTKEILEIPRQALFSCSIIWLSILGTKHKILEVAIQTFFRSVN